VGGLRVSCFWDFGLEGANADLGAEEEELLVSFFGGDYVRYRARTRARIPFIH